MHFQRKTVNYKYLKIYYHLSKLCVNFHINFLNIFKTKQSFSFERKKIQKLVGKIWPTLSKNTIEVIKIKVCCIRLGLLGQGKPVS